MKKDFRYDIAILRLLCITTVVFFHAYGMTFVHFSDTTNALYSDKYEMFNQTYLINIAMPMFIFISGFLFGGQLMRKCPPLSFGNMIKSKFMRLMVPFFVFTVLFMFTQNAVSWDPFYQWTYSHLWFLPMLFWCFVVTYFLRPLILNDSFTVGILTIILLFAIAFLGKFVPMIIGLHNVNTSIGWFTFGVWFYKYEKNIIDLFSADRMESNCSHSRPDNLFCRDDIVTDGIRRTHGHRLLRDHLCHIFSLVVVFIDPLAEFCFH